MSRKLGHPEADRLMIATVLDLEQSDRPVGQLESLVLERCVLRYRGIGRPRCHGGGSMGLSM